MSSCQFFLIPAEGGVAVAAELMLPTPEVSFIRLQERDKSSNINIKLSLTNLFKPVNRSDVQYLMFLCNMPSGSIPGCWFVIGPPTPPFTPIEFPPAGAHRHYR